MHETPHRRMGPLGPPPPAAQPAYYGAGPIDLAGHSTEQVMEIVLGVLCDRASADAACRTHGITRSQYDVWHGNFVEICWRCARQKGVVATGKLRRARAKLAPPLREAFGLIRAEPPRDICAWANERLASAWRPSGPLPLCDVNLC